MISSMGKKKLQCDATAVDFVPFGCFVMQGRYSLHVLGLVLDGRKRTAYICDPNGSLLPGGNMYVKQRRRVLLCSLNHEQ